jgi:hypothetical protein
MSQEVSNRPKREARDFEIGDPFRSHPEQLNLLPLKTVVEIPNSTGTADAWGEVLAEDSQTYIVKATRGGNRIPASEWVAAHIAEAVNMPCPTPKIVQLQNGDLLFGSRVVSGLADKTETTAILTSKSVGAGARAMPGLTSVLSAIYAFDVFTNNVDRHVENYLSVLENGCRKFYLIDLGRSLFWDNFTQFPGPHHNTVAVGRTIRQRHGFDLDAALRVLDRFAQLAPERIIGFMRSMPKEWMPDDEQEAFIKWWANGARQERIVKLRKGLSHGSLL